MVIRTDEILSVLSKLSDESGLKVTVQESVKGGVVAGTACTIGGVLLGPPGLAIGGTHSTLVNNSYCFWAVLPLEGYVLNMSDIHQYWSEMP